MTTLKDLEAKVASQNESIATLQKAYDELKKDARMMVLVIHHNPCKLHIVQI